MIRDVNETFGLSKPDAKVLDDIRTHGWHVIGVGKSRGEIGPNWAFSIGLFHSFGHPEVLVFPVEANPAMGIVNEIGAKVKKGARFLSGQEYGDILMGPYLCAFREVDHRYYHDYLGYARWFYQGNSFPVMQCLWPDKGHHFPWEAACEEGVKTNQPFLFVL